MSAFEICGGFLDSCSSSRARLARNLRGYPFGAQAPETLREIADKVQQALAAVPVLAQEFTRQELTAGSMEAQRLAEQQQISPELARSGGVVFLARSGGASIMIGEEDHLRLQVLGRGLCPKECLAEVQRLAQCLENSLPMAYDERLGYLTACPSNLGTGLRVSAQLHLPMCAAAGGVQEITSWAARQGCTLRGAFGEGTAAEGGFYQLSNQVTLGMSEGMLTDKLTALATQLMETEQKARQSMRERDEIGLADRLCRAAGVLKTARRMDTQEAQRLLSEVLMGLQMQILGGADPQEIHRAARDVRPASLTIAGGGALSETQRDEARALLLRERIGQTLTIV